MLPARSLLFLAIPFLCQAKDRQPDLTYFEENRGQAPAAVRYLARAGTFQMFLEESDTVVAVRGQPFRFHLAGQSSEKGGNGNLNPEGTLPLLSDYVIGNDPAKWRHRIANFRTVRRKGVYPGIDQLFYSNPQRLEYDFVVHPGGDPGQIRIQLIGSGRMRIDSRGQLVAQAGSSRLVQHPPAAYQIDAAGQRQQVAAAWRMKAGGVRIASLEIGAYDRRRELVIDPEFEAASAVGGTGRDQWTGLVKSGSDFYMVGSTETLEYPGAGGSHGRNITVVRLNSSLEALRVAYVGGGGKDTALAISTGQRGIRVVGETDSRDFPTGSFTSDNRPVKPQTHYGGGASDGFFFEFSFPAIYESRTTPLIYSSYVGGSAEDRVTACTAYMIAGETRSTDLPPSITGSNHGGWDAFGIYLGFDYSWQGAYIGGSGDERVKSIGAIGSYLAVAGSTTSPDLPVSNAWQNRLNGPKDGFVATVPLSVVSLPPSPLVSYWGGSGEDEIVAIQQAGGRITILGTTSSTDLPLMNPVQGAYGGGKSDVFLSQFDLPSGALQFSTYFGGPGDDIATHMAFLAPGVFEAVGTTTSERLPVKGTGQSGYGGGASDAFAVRYATGTGGVVTALQSAQYLGGSGAESVFGLADETIGINSDSPEGSWRGPKPLGAKGGGGDGFLFTLSEPVITATSEVYLTTNQTTGIGLHFGGAVPISDGIKLTLSSSDPGKVRIFDIAAGDAVATFTTIVTTRNRTLRLLGLDRAGEVTITASAEGYSPVTIRVHLVQTQWNWTMNGLILPPATLKLPVNGSAYAQLVDGYLIPGTTSLIYPGTRPSSPSETFTFESSDANVVTATSFGRNTVSLTRLTAGTVQIMASSPGLGGAVPPPPLVVETADPAPVLGYSPPATVTAALGTIYSFNVQVNGGGRVRVRIQDPSMAQLLDPLTDQPMDEVTVFARSNVRIVARSSSGSSQLIFTVDGQMAWTTAVQFTLPVIGLLPKPLALFPGESVLASLKYENFFGFDSLIEGDSVTVELISSNPSVVAVTNPRFDWARGMGVAGAPRVTGIGKGSADLTLTLVRGPDLLQFTKTHVEVPEGTLGIASAVVGKNLETALQITSSLNNTALLVESSDPSRLLVNGGPTAVVTTGAAGAAAVRVAGLADSGEVTVRVSGTGLAAANTVQLSRSGLVLTLSLPGYLPFPLFAGVTALAQPPSVSFAINTTGGLGVQPAAIGETGIPLAVQDLRPGFDAVPFRATVSDPRLLANLQISPVQKGSGGSVQFDALTTAGTARLQIEQPEGFVKPSIGAEVDLQIVRRYASVSPVTLVKDSALAIPLAYSFDRATTLTIASSDPSKVLLSVDGKSAGSASISIDTKATPQIYLYALADSGAAVITYSSPDYEVVRQDVALQPVTWMLNGFSGSSTFNPLYTSIDSQPVALTLAATAS